MNMFQENNSTSERTTFRNLSTKIIPNKKEKIIAKKLKKELNDIKNNIKRGNYGTY
jgi:hypothetical protein